MKTYNTEYEHLIRGLIEQHFGRAPSLMQPIPTYPDSIVYQIDLPSEALIFKTMDPAGSDLHGIALEAWACDRARQAGVPAPEVLVLDTSHRLFPSTYFVMRKAEGQPLADLTLDLPEARPYIRQLGHVLQHLHAITLEGFGWLDEEQYARTEAIRGVHSSWRAFLLDGLEPNLHALVTADLLNPQQVRIVEQLLDAYDALLDYPVPGRLLHGDLGSLHVWVDPTRHQITSIIDFGERKAGDPLWDLAEYDWQMRDVLLEEYGFVMDDQTPVMQRYHLYALLRAIPWARRWQHVENAPVQRWLQFTLTEAEQWLR